MALHEQTIFTSEAFFSGGHNLPIDVGWRMILSESEESALASSGVSDVLARRIDEMDRGWASPS
jgi:hypothetical protein